MRTQHTYILVAVLVVVLLIGIAVGFTGQGGTNTLPTATSQTSRTELPQEGTARIENGIQYVDIRAQAGYYPRVTKAQATIPTVIRITTENTYDCSIALVINDLNYREFLPTTGSTEIMVPVEKTQGTLRGMCSMAMYHFQIDFQ